MRRKWMNEMYIYIGESSYQLCTIWKSYPVRRYLTAVLILKLNSP